MKALRLIAVALCLFFLQTSPLPAEETADYPSGQQTPSSQDKKEKLRQDAQELSRSFRELFTDLSSKSMVLAKSVVDYIAEWVETNYEQLSEEKQEKLQRFLEKMQKEYGAMKEMSLEAMQKFLKDFQNLLDQLETPDSSAPSDQETGERI